MDYAGAAAGPRGSLPRAAGAAGLAARARDSEERVCHRMGRASGGGEGPPSKAKRSGLAPLSSWLADRNHMKRRHPPKH